MMIVIPEATVDAWKKRVQEINGQLSDLEWAKKQLQAAISGATALDNIAEEIKDGSALYQPRGLSAAEEASSEGVTKE